MQETCVTIVIPCYNQGRYLSEAIESALNQSYPDCEVVVVDDGSTDETAEVAARYARVRLLRQINSGRGAARNRGLAAGRGAYVIFLDADDRLLPEAVACGLHCLAAHPQAAFAYGHVRLIAGDGTPLPTPSQISLERDHYLELLRNNYIWTPGVVMYRRSALASVGSYNPRSRASEDFELNVRMARAFPVCCVGETVLEYRLHGENTSRNYSLMLKAAVSARRAQRRYVADNELYLRALNEGISQVQRGYGDELVIQVREDLSAKRWARGMRGILTLLRYHPRGALRTYLPDNVICRLRWLRAAYSTPSARQMSFKEDEPQ